MIKTLICNLVYMTLIVLDTSNEQELNTGNVMLNKNLSVFDIRHDVSGIEQIEYNI